MFLSVSVSLYKDNGKSILKSNIILAVAWLPKDDFTWVQYLVGWSFCCYNLNCSCWIGVDAGSLSDFVLHLKNLVGEFTIDVTAEQGVTNLGHQLLRNEL